MTRPLLEFSSGRDRQPVELCSVLLPSGIRSRKHYGQSDYPVCVKALVEGQTGQVDLGEIDAAVAVARETACS